MLYLRMRMVLDCRYGDTLNFGLVLSWFILAHLCGNTLKHLILIQSLYHILMGTGFKSIHILVWT